MWVTPVIRVISIVRLLCYTRVVLRAFVVSHLAMKDLWEACVPGGLSELYKRGPGDGRRREEETKHLR
jgi:hypothetical protein